MTERHETRVSGQQEAEHLVLTFIRRDGGTQARAALNEATVEEYLHALHDGAIFPPVVVYHDGHDYWLADGFHRVEATHRTDQQHILADIRQGNRRDAVLHAVGANAAHGLRRSNADKRRAVETLLRDAEWGQWSDREIARQCAVSQPFVSALRKEHASDNDYQMARTVQRGGTTYTMDTSGLSTPAAPAPEPARPALPPGWYWQDSSKPADIIAINGDNHSQISRFLGTYDACAARAWELHQANEQPHAPAEPPLARDAFENAMQGALEAPAAPRGTPSGPPVAIGIAPGTEVMMGTITGTFQQATQEPDGITAWVKWATNVLEPVSPERLIAMQSVPAELVELLRTINPDANESTIERRLHAGATEYRTRVPTGNGGSIITNWMPADSLQQRLEEEIAQLQARIRTIREKIQHAGFGRIEGPVVWRFLHGTRLMPFFPLAMHTNTPELWSHDQVQAMLAHDERLRQQLRKAQHDVDTARKELARVDARRFEAEQQVRLLQEQLAEPEPITDE